MTKDEAAPFLPELTPLWDGEYHFEYILLPLILS